MITQTHTLNPFVDDCPVLSESSTYFRSFKSWEIFSDKIFFRFCKGFIDGSSVGYSVFVSILNALMQKVSSSATKIIGGLGKVNLVSRCFMEYVRGDKVLDWSFKSSFRSRIVQVLCLRSFLEMMWVAASRVITNVHKHFSFLNRSVVIQGEGKPVRQKLVLPPVSVALVLGCRFPFPTNIGIFLKRNINVLPKIMVVIKPGYRIVNNIVKRFHMKPTYPTFGFSQPCYGGKVKCPS